MSNLLWKKLKLNLCFSPSSPSAAVAGALSPSNPPSPTVISDHHNRLHHHHHHHHHHHTPSIFINNFNFLYDHLSVSSPLHHSPTAFTTTPKSNLIEPQSENPAGFATVFSSNRRFRSSTAFTTTTPKSNLIEPQIEDPAGFATVFSSNRRFRSGGVYRSQRRVDSDEENDNVAVSKLLSGGMAVMKHVDSVDPYRDFGKSMREMVEARDLRRDVDADREYLHELLFCYLSLNPKHTHRFIVSAFSDTLLWLLSPSPGNFLSESG